MIKKQIESSMNSPKSIWDVINQKIGKNRKRNNNINYLTDSNQKIIFLCWITYVVLIHV